MIDTLYLETRLRSANAMAGRAADRLSRMLHEEMAHHYARQLAAMRAPGGHAAPVQPWAAAPPPITALPPLARIAA